MSSSALLWLARWRPILAVVLLDEPLSAVDGETRARLIDEVVAVQERVGIPFIYVTHNIDEATRLGTQVVVFA